jgi:hypothetical protein
LFLGGYIMKLEEGIAKAKKLSGLKNQEFYSDIVMWLEELAEFRKNANQRNYHGLRDTRLYHIWFGMKARCYNANSENYKHYGGRGIKICDEWKNDFMKFYDWAIHNGYDDSLSIDRIDVNGNYTPDNCRWATAVEQAKNKRKEFVMTLTYKNKTMTIKEWSKHLNIKEKTIRKRLESGWSVEKTLETPVDKIKRENVSKRKYRTPKSK